MISNEIRNFFGQLNFLLIATNVPGVTIMKNVNNGDTMYVVLMDHDNGQVWSTGILASIHKQLSAMHSYPDPPAQILFLILTEDISRDRLLTLVDGPTVWLVDSKNRKLLVYENQKDDFFGLRYGLEKTIEAGRNYNPWNIREAVKDKTNFPFVTVALIAVNVIWFIILSFMGDTNDAKFMWSMGADFGYSVFVDYEFYRLLLSMFMHFGFLHLFGNMVYLAIAGFRSERVVGHLRFFLIYMLSGLASSLLSTAYYYLTDQYTVSAGASGAIYGIIGLIIYLTARYRGRMSRAQMTSRIMIILIFFQER